MSKIMALKLLISIILISIFLSGCSVYTHRVDMTIKDETNENSESGLSQISIYRVDQFVSNRPVLVYENEKLVGEVAGGEYISWKTPKGTKNISAKYGEAEDCFMLNFSCIFNSTDIAKPIDDDKHKPTNSLSMEIDNKSSYSLLLKERRFGNEGALKVTSEEFATEAMKKSDRCEDLGFGIFLGSSALVVSLPLSTVELILGTFASIGVGEGGYSICM